MELRLKEILIGKINSAKTSTLMVTVSATPSKHIADVREHLEFCKFLMIKYVDREMRLIFEEAFAKFKGVEYVEDEFDMKSSLLIGMMSNLSDVEHEVTFIPSAEDKGEWIRRVNIKLDFVNYLIGLYVHNSKMITEADVVEFEEKFN